MDEQTDRKIRDLRLKIQMLEKELTQTQYTLNRGAFLRAGHAGQITRTAEKDRARIQQKLDDIHTKLAELEGGAPIAATIAKQEPVAEKPAPITPSARGTAVANEDKKVQKATKSTAKDKLVAKTKAKPKPVPAAKKSKSVPASAKQTKSRNTSRG